MTIRHVASSAFLLTLLAVFAWPVAADCDLDGPLEEVLPDAPVAFVGTVIAVEGGSARFAVEEVWAGNVGSEVDVRGLGWNAIGPDGAGRGPVEPFAPNEGLMEDDRAWEVGVRYLAVPTVEEDILRDHQCTATTEWREELSDLRPADAVLAPGAQGGEVPVPLIVAGAAVLLLAIGSALAFRKG